ncbi:MAG: ABC transporter ATP-binding protein [Solirubrobacterales bacterium]
MKSSAVAVEGIGKRFGTVTALDDVCLEIRAGEVHALLGENGAGKTTLMKVLGGFLAADEGTISVHGEEVEFGSPRDALAHGIGMVHQHFRLVDRFTAAENIALGHEVGGARFDRKELKRGAQQLIDQYGLEVPLDVPVWQLALGEQQRVEILRILAGGAETLILDEPTAVLTPEEADALGGLLRQLAAAGRAVVLISHKIREILEFADRATVLRGGKTVGTVSLSGSSAEELSAMMFGAGSSPRVERPADHLIEDRPALVAEGICVDGDRGLEVVHELSLRVRRGEIVGIAGVAGNGQVELAEALVGLRPTTAGTIEVAGEDLTGRSPREFTRAGIAFIPEDRMTMGLSRSDAIWRNAILRRYDRAPIARGPFLRRRAAKHVAADLSTKVNLSTGDVDTPVFQLSGGNAQKLLVGRELEAGYNAVVAVNPTQGLDVSAVAQVGQMLLEASEAGVGTLLISSELEEVMRLSDRILVLFEGRFVAEFEGFEADVATVGQFMAGHGVPSGGSGV